MLLACSAVPAQEKPAGFEQLGKDLLSNIDAWTRQAEAGLKAKKPVGEADLDSIFGESFFAGSEDPLRDLELAQKHIADKLSDRSGEIEASYGRWMQRKLAPAEMAPEVIPGDESVTVRLKVPENASDSLKVDIAGRMIKMRYDRAERRRVTKDDGTVGFSTFKRRQHRAMPIPEGADPAKYRVKAAGGRMDIIFDRLKKGRQRREASK